MKGWTQMNTDERRWTQTKRAVNDLSSGSSRNFGIGGVLGLGILAKETVASPRRPHRRRAMRMLRMHLMQRICSTCETALRSARARTIIFDNDLGRLLAPQRDRCAVDNASSRLLERGVVRPYGADPKHSW